MISTSFRVRVPVLSLQIVVAEPIVSQAESLLTCSLNFNKLTEDIAKYLREVNASSTNAYQCFISHHFPHWIRKPEMHFHIKEGYSKKTNMWSYTNCSVNSINKFKRSLRPEIEEIERICHIQQSLRSNKQAHNGQRSMQ